MKEEIAQWLLDNEDKWEYDVVTNEYRLLSEEAPEEVKTYFEKKNKILKLFKGSVK